MPIVRATTRMVVVNVVVHDKKGAAVGDLTRDNFTVLDGGQKQEVSIFSVESGRALQGPVEPLPPNTFSNHVKREGGVPANVAVILLDVLNTQFKDLVWAKRQVNKFLSQLQPGDRVALYVLGRQLHVVQDFTTDAAPLLEALRHEANTLSAIPSAGGVNEASTGISPEFSGPAAEAEMRLESGMADRMQIGPDLPQGVDNRTGRGAPPPNWIREGPDLRRGLLTAAAIEAIANHLSGLRGRKSLIWVTGDVPNPLVFVSNDRPPAINLQLAEKCARMVRALNDADVAIYPVDARGLFGDPGFYAEFELNDRGKALERMTDVTSAMIDYAERTGGRAYFNTNDLKSALRSALGESDLTYTLGYYPSGARWDGRYRRIKVEVDRSGLQVRHRQGYLATAGAPPEKTDRRAILQEAAASPLDETAMGLTATLEPSKNSAESKFQVSVLIDPRGVTSQPANGVRSVLLDVLAGQYSNQGNPLGGVTNTISADLKEPDYEKMVRAGGFKLTFDYNVKPGGGELRVVVRDVLSGSIGSLHIPLDQLGLRSR